MISVSGIAQKSQSAKVKYAELCIKKNKGHLSSGLSCAEIVATLYYSVLRIKPQEPNWCGRDRFVMSKNHGMGIVYPILCDLGYFDEDKLNSYQDNGSNLGTHSKISVPGVDFGGGSLGMGLGVACGFALAAKSEKSDRVSFCLLGDCECHEGSVWESIMFAGSNKLSNLVAIVDVNGEGCTDFMENLLELRPFKAKFEAFGWEVYEIEDGHDIGSLIMALQSTRERVSKSDKPLCIIAKTKKGNGIPSFFEKKPWLHGQTPVGSQGEFAIAELLENEVGAYGVK